MDGRKVSEVLCCVFGRGAKTCQPSPCFIGKVLASIGEPSLDCVCVTGASPLSHPVFTAEQYQQHQEQLVLMQKQQLEQSQQQPQQQPKQQQPPPQKLQQQQPPPQKLQQQPQPQKLQQQPPLQPTTNTQVSEDPASLQSQCE